MKKFVAIIMLFTSINTFAQGDAYFNVKYKGYINGEYIIDVTSKQGASCNPQVHLEWSGATVTSVSPCTSGDYHTLQLTGTTTTFHIKAHSEPNPVFKWKILTICDWKGSSPTTITTNMLLDLPVKFTGSPEIVAVYEDYVTVSFTVAEQFQLKQYNIRFSKDDSKTWYTAAVVIPDNTVAGKTYSVNVKINP